MSVEDRVSAVPPQRYDFRDWEYFQWEASRFHDLTSGGRNLVNDRIATFRSLMSPRVVKHLGSLVNIHPRYEATEGWQRWLLMVRDALRAHDPTILDAVTTDSLCTQFRSGKISAAHLWTELDNQVSRGDISSDEQRQIFWEAHSWDKQALLVQECVYFDPQDPVWRAEEPVSNRKYAEQQICHAAINGKVTDALKSKKQQMYFLLFQILMGVAAAIIMIVVGAVVAQSNGSKAVLLAVGIVLLVIELIFIIALGELGKTVQNLSRQKESIKHYT